MLERTEYDNNFSQSDPRQRYYRFGGIDMGVIGNNGSDNIDFDASIAERTAAAPTSPGAFRGGATTGTPFADFDMAYDAVNGSSEAMVASYYSVRAGDTLASIAQTVWGDASLWYMLAEANGLQGTSATATLTEGTGLIVPEKGSNFHNNADRNPAAATLRFVKDKFNMFIEMDSEVIRGSNFSYHYTPHKKEGVIHSPCFTLTKKPLGHRQWQRSTPRKPCAAPRICSASSRNASLTSSRPSSACGGFMASRACSFR